MNKIDLPPSDFSNAMNDIDPKFDFSNWRKSKEWKIFVKGYNYCVYVANDTIKSKYNMGETSEKLFGDKSC